MYPLVVYFVLPYSATSFQNTMHSCFIILWNCSRKCRIVQFTERLVRRSMMKNKYCCTHKCFRLSTNLFRQRILSTVVYGSQCYWINLIIQTHQFVKRFWSFLYEFWGELFSSCGAQKRPLFLFWCILRLHFEWFIHHIIEFSLYTFQSAKAFIFSNYARW